MILTEEMEDEMSDADLEDYMKIKSLSQSKKFMLKPLPYSMDGLKPVFTEEFMETFYKIHHSTYTNYSNVLLSRVE